MLDEVQVPPVNQQQLDIRSTPRAEMRLYPLDTFEYEYAGTDSVAEVKRCLDYCQNALNA